MSTTVITGATVVAGRDLAPLAEAGVVLDDELIVAVEPTPPTSLPRGAAVVDAAGLTLAPGFVDCHVHIGLHSPHEVLTGGVTTVRDLGWPPDRIHPLAVASQTPDFSGPSILAAGPMLTAPGGYPTRAPWAPSGTGREVASAEAAPVVVDEVADDGACVVKVALNPAVGPTLPRDVLEAIVAAAHARGLRVTAHVFGLDQLDKALDCGVNELAHLLMSEERVPEAVTRLMVSRGVTVVPTIACFFGRARRIAVANLADFRAARGSIVYGTDLGNRGPRPGIDPREIAGMTEAGYSPTEILRSGTVAAAGHLGLERAGVIEPGCYADIVALGGRPLEKAADLTDVRMVWRRGRRMR
jgi:imidazolonepropionase-like amidohydrolase